MALLRWVVAAVAILALLPSASAASATALAIVGETHATGAFDGAIAVADGRGISWSASAKSVVVTSDRINFTSANPLHRSSNATTIYQLPVHSTRSFGVSNLDATKARPHGAVLIRGVGAPVSGDVRASPRADLVALRDPSLGASGGGESGGLNSGYFVTPSAQFPGNFIQLTTSAGDLVLAGTITLDIFDVDYLLTSAGQSAAETTGRSDDLDAGGVTYGHVTRESITLVDATLRLTAPAGIVLLSAAPTLDFEGTLTATHLLGDLADGPLHRASEGVYAGRATMVLHGNGDMMSLDPPVAAESARVAVGGSSWALTAVGIGALVAIGVITFLIVRRTRRADDDIGAALLFMEEKRFAEALVPLARVVARRPYDALVQLDLAICLEETGDRAGARAAYERAIHLAPANAEALYYYARLLARMAQGPESEAHLRDALLLDARLEEMALREPAFRGNLGVSR